MLALTLFTISVILGNFFVSQNRKHEKEYSTVDNQWEQIEEIVSFNFFCITYLPSLLPSHREVGLNLQQSHRYGCWLVLANGKMALSGMTHALYKKMRACIESQAMFTQPLGSINSSFFLEAIILFVSFKLCNLLSFGCFAHTQASHAIYFFCYSIGNKIICPEFKMTQNCHS